MSDTKMLQAIIDGQSALKEELLKKIDQVDRKVDEVKGEVLENRKRIDKIGLGLAELSDDAPTVEEFDKLEKRVSKIENRMVKN